MPKVNMQYCNEENIDEGVLNKAIWGSRSPSLVWRPTQSIGQRGTKVVTTQAILGSTYNT